MEAGKKSALRPSGPAPLCAIRPPVLTSISLKPAGVLLTLCLHTHPDHCFPASTPSPEMCPLETFQMPPPPGSLPVAPANYHLSFT